MSSLGGPTLKKYIFSIAIIVSLFQASKRVDKMPGLEPRASQFKVLHTRPLNHPGSPCSLLFEKQQIGNCN